MRILVVEDDRKVASFIRKGLEEEGHAVEVAGDGAEALERVADGSAWDLVVLDVMLPKHDGFSVLKTLREDGLTAPVLMLTARDAVGDRVTGLDLGMADLTLDPATREVRRGNRRVELTAREYTLLEYFMRSPGRILSRPMLAQHVWGLDFDSESNVVDVYVGYLRRRIEASGEKKLLHTVRGVGYVLKDEA